MKDGWNLRFTNLPTGTTYSFTEGDAANFKFVSAEKTNGVDSSFKVEGKKASGTIETYDAVAYQIIFTNDYALVDVTVDKVWDDDSNKGGKRPETLTLTLNGLPTGTDAPTATVTKSEDGNTWTYTWSGLPKYDAEGAEIAYTVSENAVPTGYDVSNPATVSNNGTITNTLQTGTLKITKEISGLPADVVPANLSFTVKDADDNTVATLSYADLSDETKNPIELPVGTYTVTESGTDYTNYTLETTQSTITASATVTKGQEATAALKNVYSQDKGTLTITKTITGLLTGERLKA